MKDPTTPYAPASRRPIAGVFRRTADAVVRLCVARGVHPDVISLASIATSAIAAACFCLAWRWPVLLLLVAPLPCYVRLWLNMLIIAGCADGHGARTRDDATAEDVPLTNHLARARDRATTALGGIGARQILPMHAGTGRSTSARKVLR